MYIKISVHLNSHKKQLKRQFHSVRTVAAKVMNWHEYIKKLCDFQEKIIKEIGQEKVKVDLASYDYYLRGEGGIGEVLPS